jgi:HEAT repeat protein
MSNVKAVSSIGGGSRFPRMAKASFLLAMATFLFPVMAFAQAKPSSGYKIGLAAPLTGGLESLGKEMEQAATDAVNAINHSGGLLGQKVVLEKLDDAGSPERAVAVARQFTDPKQCKDRVCPDAVIGHPARTAWDAAKIYHEANMLFISPFTSPDSGQSSFPKAVHLRPPAARWTEAAAGIIALGNQQAKFGRNWGILHLPRSTYVQDASSHLKRRLEDKKLMVLFNEAMEEKQGAVFQRLVSEKRPEGLFFVGLSPASVQNIIGEKPPNLPMILLGTPGQTDHSWKEFNEWKQRTHAVRNIYVFTSAALSDDFRNGKPRSTPWQESYWRAMQGGKQPTFAQIHVFTAFDLLAQAVQERKRRDSNAVRQALSDKPWPTFMGKLQVGKSGEIQGSSFRLHGSYHMGGSWQPSLAVLFDRGPKFEDQPAPTGRDRLMGDLQSPDQKVRHNAIRALANRKDKGAVKPLMEALKNSDAVVRSEAAAALGKHGDRGAVPPLIEALKDPEEMVRAKAAESLGRLEDRSAVQPLIRALEDRAPKVRAKTAEALGEIEDKAAVQPLIRSLEDPAPEVRSASAAALGQIRDKAAVPPLVKKAMEDGAPEVRSKAASALARQGEKAALQPLRGVALNDTNSDVRSSATEAIRELEKSDIQPGPPKEEPVYNVEANPKKSQDPLVLLPGKETNVIFYIGPQADESVTKGLLPVDMIIGGYKAGKMELSVTLNCSLCEKQTYYQQEIAYRPNDRKSSKARFTILPSSAAVRQSNGLGELLFTVEHGGNVLDRVRVPAFVGDPTAEGKKAYAPPAKVQVETSPMGEAKPPDVTMVVGFADVDGKIPIVIKPRHESLQKVFLDDFGDAHEGSGPDMAWKFNSGVSKADVDGLVFDIYKVFRTIMEQKRKDLQNDYKRIGFDVTLQPGAARLDITPKDGEKMLEMLREEGGNLYWRIFREGEGDLGKAMDHIENLDLGHPVRVTIQAVNIYAPWQILYPTVKRRTKDAEGKGVTDPNKFWGFRYLLGIMHEKDSVQGRQRNISRSPKADEIVFAGWRGSDLKDEVTERANKLLENINGKINAKVEPSFERGKFVDKVEKRAPDIRFVFAYGHATGGTVLDEKKPIVSGIEWLPAHFKFSENDLLVPRHFDDLAKKVQLKAQPVVILDACETGTFGINAMNNNGFVGAFTRLGAGAVIVTESPVLANFAYHFGMNLIDELFDRKADVSQAMLNVRRKHLKEWNNPLGLVYTLYGNPTARVKGQ